MATAAYLARFQQPPPVIPEGETLARLESCGGPVLSRLKQLHLLTDPRQLVSSWCRLCSRMLGLGWAGPAFGPDNLTVCGGIRSLLGLFDLRTLDEPEAAEEAIEASLRSLAEGVAQLLEASPVQCLEPVRLEVHQHCREQVRQGLMLPPPLLQAVINRPAFDRIVDRRRT